MRVIFIHGPAAAGKHTIGTRLSERTGLPLFHNHLAVDLTRALFEFGSDGFRRLRARLWLAAFEEAAAAAQSFIFTFAPEATVDPALIGELVAVVENAGGRVLFVELRCARAALLQRLGNESRARFGKLRDEELYLRIEQQGGFEFPALPEPLLTIDTTGIEAEDAAMLIEVEVIAKYAPT